MTLFSSRGSVSFDNTRDFYVPMSTENIELPQSSTGQGSINEETDINPSWRSLFSFTTRQHTASIIYCAITTFASGILRPVASIFFGYIFSILTQYGAGTLGPGDTRHQISTWCAALTATGVAAWVIQGTFLSAWMIFGELQARSVREQMFTCLLDKEMEWYDLRKDGMGSLLIRIQT